MKKKIHFKFESINKLVPHWESFDFLSDRSIEMMNEILMRYFEIFKNTLLFRHLKIDLDQNDFNLMKNKKY